MGRTLLSDAFDFDFADVLQVVRPDPSSKVKSKVKGVGQECPTHTPTALPALLQVGEHLARDFLQGFKHSRSLEGDRFNQRLVFPA